MELELAQARQTFIIESREQLDAMETALLALEKSPDDAETINSLFRSAHTIKGASGILGLDDIERFTHVAESLLSKVRDAEIRIDGAIIELLLECRDHISGLVELAAAEAGGMPEGVRKNGEGLIKRLNGYLGEGGACGGPAEKVESTVDDNGWGATAKTDAWHISLRFGREILKNGMDPVAFLNYLQKLGEITSLTTLSDQMPSAPDMDPENCYLGFEVDFKSDFGKKAIEDVFEFVREDSFISILPPKSRIGSYVELIKGLPEDTTLLGEILIRGGALTETELDEALRLQGAKATAAEGAEGRGKKTLIGQIMVDEGMVQPEIVDAALEKQRKSQISKTKEASTIRIDAAKLDALVNLVGELVISSANMEQHAERLKDAWLRESASVMLRLVEEIRDTTMKARMVPIGETFSRFNRVVRDISRDIGKEIELRISGGETELDKTVIEKINDPLMHIVRNAADHGIETPEARAFAGKPQKGTISLNAYHDAGFIVIEVSDDGRGLNRQRILEKAVRNGLLPASAAPADAELYRLIFEPGFSTAEQVTNLSGRGVGMDVVKRNIEGLRGAVDVESVEGAGATVRIRLPLTMAIIDGFMVGVGGSRYVIPLDMVVECIDLDASERRASGRKSYVNLRGEVLPYVRLREFFGERGAEPRFENIVIVRYAGQKIGLVVDELFGEVQAVIKSLGKAYKDVKGISGATILGNGMVALIVDVPRLVETAEAAELSRAVS